MKKGRKAADHTGDIPGHIPGSLRYLQKKIMRIFPEKKFKELFRRKKNLEEFIRRRLEQFLEIFLREFQKKS